MFVGYADYLDSCNVGLVRDGGLTCQLGARTLNLINAPVGLVARVLDVAIAVFIAMPFNLLTAGTIEGLNGFTNASLYTLDNVLSKLALNLLRVINPCARLEARLSLTERLNVALVDVKTGNANHPFNYHVTNRFNAIVYALAYVVARAVDVVLGTAGLVLAAATLGTYPLFNRMAYSALAFPGLIRDIYRCAMLLINPGVQTSDDLRVADALGADDVVAPRHDSRVRV